MRDDVLIVLNEREPLKKQMAGELSEQLELRGIAHCRTRPEGDLSGLISIRRPRVLVLDYILGDVGTALDILAKFRTEMQEQINVIVWTDEPSVGAAVTALKLGAFDYIEMLPGRSLERVLLSIETAFESFPEKPAAKTIAERFSPIPPVGDSPVFKRCLALVEGQAVNTSTITFLLGPTGCGRNRLAEYIHACRQQAGAYITADFDLFTGSIEEIIGDTKPSRIVPWLSNGATVFIDHVEFDTGELLEALEKRLAFLENYDYPVKLIVGSSSAETATAWNRLLDCSICSIPALADHCEDILPLLNFFTGRFSGPKAVRAEFSAALILKLAELPWPGNVRQLRAAAVEAAAGAYKEKNGAEPVVTGLDRHSAAAYEAIKEAKERWERFESGRSSELNPFLVRRALESSNGSFRIAAARLGTGVSQLRQILNLARHDEASR